MKRDELITEILKSELLKRPVSDICITVFFEFYDRNLNGLRKTLQNEFYGRDSRSAHITLLISALPKNWEDLKEDLIQKLKADLQKTGQVEIDFDSLNLEFNPENLFAGINIKSKVLNSLNKSLSLSVNKFRNGEVRQKTLKELNTLVQTEAEEILKSGYERNGKNYQPHFTLVYTKKDFRNKINISNMEKHIKELVSKRSFRITFDKAKIIIYRERENGSFDVLFENEVSLKI